MRTGFGLRRRATVEPGKRDRPDGQMCSGEILLASHWQANAQHEITPSRIGMQGIEHGHCQLYDSKHPLLIRLLKIREASGQISETDVDDGEIKRGDVPLLRRRLQAVEDFERPRLVA